MLKSMFWIFVAGGAINSLGATYWLIRSLKRINAWLPATGVIVEFPHQGKDDFVGSPKVSFIAKDGNEYTFTASVGSSNYLLRQHVGVLYDPADPQRAMINDDTNLFAIPWIGFGVGTVFWVLAWCSQG